MNKEVRVDGNVKSLIDDCPSCGDNYMRVYWAKEFNGIYCYKCGYKGEKNGK